MHSRREPTRHLALLLNSVDRLGRTVEAPILSIAQEIAPRAVTYGEKLLGDPALALTLFEEAAATVSRTLRKKATSNKAEIRDLRGYLFRAYLRRINVERKTGVLLESATEEEFAKQAGRASEIDLDRQILVKELLESCDTFVREIIYLKLEGCSWKEIEERCGIPLNAANLRFSKAIRRLKRLVRAGGHSI
jgi:DNA-directed RNA polymerase specialized sigma24 family protein